MADLTIRPFLMFIGQAEEAMNFYLLLFSRTKILDIQRYGANSPGVEGSVKKASFSIGGQTVLCTDSFVNMVFPSLPHFLSLSIAHRKKSLAVSTRRWQRAVLN